MSILTSHDITLYGGNGRDIVLRPLCDAHLPLLYGWYADPEVLYWCEEDDVQCQSAEDVRGMYGAISRGALCFLIEVDGTPVGDCWLQRMNLPDVLALYPDTADVRRIDMAVGEKGLWGKGIGTQFVGMLAEYAFCGERVDVLHCIVDDYNKRSRRVFEKNGFCEVSRKALPHSVKAKEQIHLTLTRREFVERRRVSVPENERIWLSIADLQPSQLYVSEGKLRLVTEWFAPDRAASFDPIPVRRFGDRLLMTDGHTRAVAACLAGWTTVPAYWDTDELDMRAYAADVKWCDREGIRCPVDLVGRVVPHKEYERLWRKRCMERDGARGA